MKTDHRFFKVAIVANPRLGSSSFSSRLAHTLASQGHTVYFLSPKRYPDFFDGHKFDLSKIEKLSSVQSLDLVIFADGISPISKACNLNGSTAIGALMERFSQIQEYGQFAADFHVCVGEAVYSEASAAYEDIPVFKCTPMPDRALLEVILGNSHIQNSQIICVQDASEDRVRFLQCLIHQDDLSITCFGEGWPSQWCVNVQAEQKNAFAYRAGSNSICVVFGSEGSDGYDVGGCSGLRHDEVPESVIALLRAKGCGLAYIDMDTFNLKFPGEVDDSESDFRSYKDFDDTYIKDADSPLSDSRLSAGTHAPKQIYVSERGNLASSQGYLDDELPGLLEGMHDLLSPRGKMRGRHDPKKTISVLGYVGIGNFGDEYILKTIDERMRSRVGGANIVAVCERPCQVIETRGIFAVNLGDKFYLDRLLSDSVVALVMAGLLFDQGIALTMGVAELFSDAPYTDLPGIASYVLLAKMRGAKPIFYGIGAGPLDIGDSKTLVRLMADNGSIFLTRDQHSADAIEDCGVSKDRVFAYADAAFLGTYEQTGTVDGWLESAGIEENASILAVSLREYPGCGPDFVERIALALDIVANQNEVTIVFCLLDPSDESVSRQVAEKVSAESHIFNPYGDINSVCELLNIAKAGLSMRYHASVILNKCGHPSVGLGYLPKVVSLYDSVGTEALLCEMDDTSETIAAKMQDMLSNIAFWEEVVKQGANKQKVLAQKAEDVVITSLMDSLNGPHDSETLFLFDRSSTEREIDDLKMQCLIADKELMLSRDLLNQEKGMEVREAPVSYVAKRLAKKVIRKLSGNRYHS